MPNKNLLSSYCNELCKVLNENGFRERIRIGGEIKELQFKTDNISPEVTIMSITDNSDAFLFLKNENLIRSDICHFCGESPIDDNYSFTEPKNLFKFNICRTCHSRGQREQEIFKDSKKPSKGCLVSFAMIFLVLIIVVIVIGQ